MKTITYIFFGLIIMTLFVSSCAGPGTVTVGVGVGVGGPWVGPHGYPGGTVWVGRPLTPVYYHLDPVNEEGTEFVQTTGRPLQE